MSLAAGAKRDGREWSAWVNPLTCGSPVKHFQRRSTRHADTKAVAASHVAPPDLLKILLLSFEGIYDALPLLALTKR